MECKCKFFLRNEEGELYCTQCGKLAHSTIEDKAVTKKETKEAPLYVSDKSKKRIIPKGVSKIGR